MCQERNVSWLLKWGSGLHWFERRMETTVHVLKQEN